MAVVIETKDATYALRATVHAPSTNEYTISVYDLTDLSVVDDTWDPRLIVAQYHFAGDHAMLSAIITFFSLLDETG